MYCTVESILSLVNISFAQDIPNGRILQAEQEAETIINSKLQGVYPVPFPDDSVPDIIKLIIAPQLSLCRLMILNNLTKMPNEDEAYSVDVLCKDVYKRLDDLATGNIGGVLPSETDITSSPPRILIYTGHKEIETEEL